MIRLFIPLFRRSLYPNRPEDIIPPLLSCFISFKQVYPSGRQLCPKVGFEYIHTSNIESSIPPRNRVQIKDISERVVGPAFIPFNIQQITKAPTARLSEPIG